AMSPSAISRVRGGTENAIMETLIATCELLIYFAIGISATSILSVPRQHVVRQRQEGVALRAGRERVERLLRLLREVDGAAVGVVDRRVFLQAAQQFVPLLGRRVARGDDVADDPGPRPSL